ncbi:MAG: efflux RND transporter periplasmic adaptor subunit [Planctomycetota bacterium]
MAKRRRGYGIWLLVAAGVLLIGYGFVPRALDVEVARVERAPLRETVEELARTRLRDRFVVSAPIAGVAARITFEVGDRIEVGAQLATLAPLRSSTLDPRSLVEATERAAAASARLERSQAALEAAATDAEYWRAESARRTELYERKIITLQELDIARTESRRGAALERSAHFDVDTARHEALAAAAALRYGGASEDGQAVTPISITSPVAGVVLAVRHESEGVVAAGTALLEVGDPASLEVVVEALSFDAVRMQPGYAVELSRWGGERSLTGVVARVEPVGFTKVSALGVEEQRVLVILELMSPAAEWRALGDGYRLEATIVVWSAPDALVAPSSALVRSGSGWSVFTVKAGRAELTPVEIGHQSAARVEILSGLAAGDTVIPHPDPALVAGIRVRVK